MHDRLPAAWTPILITLIGLSAGLACDGPGPSTTSGSGSGGRGTGDAIGTGGAITEGGSGGAVGTGGAITEGGSGGRSNDCPPDHPNPEVDRPVPANPLFATRKDYPSGPNGDSVVAADFNGDGKDDIAVANADACQTVRVFLNNGDGSFGAPVKYPAGTYPTGMRAGDLNGDGRVDLVVANDVPQGGLSVLLNAGAGTFSAPVHNSFASWTRLLALADINVDGRPDLVVRFLDGQNGNLNVMLNAGGGVFSAPVEYPLLGIEDWETAVAGDFNGDGAVDLVSSVTMDTGSGEVMYFVRVLINDGHGAFTKPVRYDLGPDLRWLPTSGDFNGDGKPDLAFANGHESAVVTLLMNNGDGTFGTAAQYPIGGPISDLMAATDLNGDGMADLLLAGHGPGIQADPPSHFITILLSGVRGPLSVTTRYRVDHPVSLASTDLNGDGKTDLVVANGGFMDIYGRPVDGTLSLLTNAGNGTFGPTGYPTDVLPALFTAGAQIGAGDFNQDGKVDLAIVGFRDGPITGGVDVLLNRGGSDLFGTAGPYPIEFPTSCVVGDLNGDRKDDLAVVVGTGSGSSADGSVHPHLEVMLNVQASTLGGATTYPTGSDPQAIAMGDVSGDGKADLAVSDSDGTLRVFLNQGDGTFGDADTYLTAAGVSPNGQWSIAIQDMNGDGFADIAVLHAGGVSILSNKGAGTFADAISHDIDGYPASSLAVGDLDGDGRADLAVANHDHVSVRFNNGDGSFASETTYPTDENAIYLALGDLDGDGRLDIAVANLGGVSVLSNLGNGAFAAASNYPVGGLTQSLALVDLNGDGKLDVAVTSGTGERDAMDVVVLLNISP